MVPYDSNLTLFPAGEFLAGRGANHTSQFGEDGLIEACIERFGTENRCCFEVGAHDGLLFSNTHRLRCSGWRAVLIEADPQKFVSLCLNTQGQDRTRCVLERIDGTSLDRILSESNMPRDIDFGVIDIDGQDYWAWDGMTEWKPRLMLVEFDYGSENAGFVVPSIGGPGQATMQAILTLGELKGYTPLAKTTVNLLFVKTELL